MIIKTLVMVIMMSMVMMSMVKKDDKYINGDLSTHTHLHFPHLLIMLVMIAHIE